MVMEIKSFSGLTCSFQQDHGKPQPARTAVAQLHCKCSRDKARSLGFSLAQSIWCIMKFKNHKKPKEAGNIFNFVPRFLHAYSGV